MKINLIERLEEAYRVCKRASFFNSALAIREASDLLRATPANSRAEAIGAALDHAISTLEGLSHIYDGNPSLAMADMPEVEYARHMLGEARKEAREAVKHCRALVQQEGE